MPDRDATFDFPLSPDGPRDREAIARELDRLDLPTNARAVMRAIFSAIWPATAAAPAALAMIRMPDLQAATSLSKGTISPLLGLLKAGGWIVTQGKGDKYRVNWGQLFESGVASAPRFPQGVATPQDNHPAYTGRSPQNEMDRRGRLDDRSNRSNSQVGPVQPVQINDDTNWTGPIKELDRSNRSNYSTTPVQPVQFGIGPVGPIEAEQSLDELDRLDRSTPELDRSNSESWTDWTGPIEARDAFTPLERLANDYAELLSVLRLILERLDALESGTNSDVEKLDRYSDEIEKLDRLDRSNRSNSAPYIYVCNVCKCNIHNINMAEIGPVQSVQSESDLELTPVTPDRTQATLPFPDADESQHPPPANPQSTETPNMLGDFRWPEELYDREKGKGLEARILETNTGRDRLWEWAAEYAGWPRTELGRIEFHALVIYCRRTQENPGGSLTNAVKARKAGSRWNVPKRDMTDAYATVGRKTPPPAVPTRPTQPAPARDYTAIDAQLATLDEDQLREMLPNTFAKSLFAQARAKGLPLLQPQTVLWMLRKAVDAPAPPPPLAISDIRQPSTDNSFDARGLDLAFTTGGGG